MEPVGTITKIEMQKNNKQRCSIFVDGKFLLGVSAELIYQFDLDKGEVLTTQVLNQLLDQEELLAAKQDAFNLLSYRQRSRKELKERLLKKEYSLEVVNGVINVLERLDYIDDQQFATSWIKDRITKGFGPYRIRCQLEEKGVSSNIINDCLEEQYDTELEYKLAAKLAAKKRKHYLDEEQYEQRYKLSQVLKRKGFSFEIIDAVLNDLLEEGD
ncbi:MAG: RecX family transcriptional regulator [Bacillota bacterium]